MSKNTLDCLKLTTCNEARLINARRYVLVVTLVVSVGTPSILLVKVGT